MASRHGGAPNGVERPQISMQQRSILPILALAVLARGDDPAEVAQTAELNGAEAAAAPAVILHDRAV